MNPATLLTWLEGRLPEALAWLERMVAVNSYTTNRDGVDALGRLTAEAFAGLGLVPEQVPSSNPAFGSHLFLAPPGQGAPEVLLVSHLDTVFPPEEEERENFRWRPAPEEGRIYGPGTVDIKGGTLLIWLVLHALREFAPRHFTQTRWLIALNASEEVLSADFARRVEERCPAGVKAVLVYEGGPRVGPEHHLVTSRKGRAEYRLRAEGRAAHAGSSHAEGINAIVTLAQAVASAARLTDYASGLTVNVGAIRGGTVTNRVPHEAVAELEMRAFDPDVLAAAQQSVENLAHPLRENLQPPQAALIVETLGTTPAWPHDARTGALFDVFAAAALELDLPLLPATRGGLSDANYLCHLGPTLDGLGPCGGNAHCSEHRADGSKVPEYVEPASFPPKAALSVLAILDLLDGDGGPP